VSAEDVDALRKAYRHCAIAWRLVAAWKPDDFAEFGSPEMRRKLPLHRLYAIEERWQAGADAERPLHGLEPLGGFGGITPRRTRRDAR
jgi:hypothetical protein